MTTELYQSEVSERELDRQRALRRARGGLRGTNVDIHGCTTNLLAVDIERATETIVCDIQDATEGLIESHGVMGTRDYPERASTDDECCLIKFNVDLAEEFDVRSPLPEQVAAWLREQASHLMDIAEILAATEDTRDLQALRRYVAGDSSVRFDYEHGEFISADESEVAA